MPTVTSAPIRIVSTPNVREHWHQRAKRAREHKAAAFYALRAARAPHSLPCTVTLTRVAPRTLDDDNLIGGCKALRDGIAELWLNVDDADPRVTWVYKQRRGGVREYAVEIEITP